MSLMPGAWAMAGRRLPMNGEARHRLVGSSLPPPCLGGGTDRDIDRRTVDHFKLVDLLLSLRDTLEA